MDHQHTWIRVPSRTMWITLFLILTIFTTAYSQSTNETQTTQANDAAAIDKAIAPVYKMAGIFLEVVIRPTNLSQLNATVDMRDFNAVFQSIQTDWKVWLKNYTAYIVCLIVGVLYILFLPITGCIICGCRSRGRCRANHSEKPSKKITWSRRICTLLFLLLCVGVLFGVICMFLANDALHKHTDESGLPNILQESISRLERFLQMARDSFDTYLNSQLIPNVEALRDKLSNLPGEIQKEVGINTGIGPLMETMITYTDKLNTTKNNLLAIDNTVATIEVKVNALSDKLSELKNNITRDFSSCATAECEVVKNISSMLETTLDYSGVGNLAVVISEFTAVLEGTGNIYDSMQDAQNTYNKIGDAVRNGTVSVIDGLTIEGNKVIAEIQSFLNSTLADLNDLVPLDTARTTVSDTLNPYVQRYGNYVYYAGIAISTAMLLITTIFFFGLLFGACGNQTSRSNECCRKSSAVSLLKAGLVFLFIFCCVIMLVVAVSFPVGGILHNDVCRHFKLPPPDQQSANIVDDMITNSIGLPVSFLQTYAKCQEDDSLYNALQLETRDGFDLDTILNPSQYDIKSKLDEVKQGTYEPGDMEIATTQLMNNIQALTSAEGNVDLSSHQVQLAKDTTSQNLKQFSDYLTVMAVNATTAAEFFSFYATMIESISQNEYGAVEGSVNRLKDLIAAVTTFLNEYNISATVMELEAKQGDATSAATTNAIDTVVPQLNSDFEELLTNAKDSIKSNVARCGPVADIISELLDSVCGGFLQPFNAFWFSTGWSLVFFIFVIPISVILIDFYKRGSPYQSETPPDARSATSTTELVRNDRRRGSDRSKYAGRALPDPNNTEPRAGRVPYQELPVVSGARASPLQPPRHYQNRTPQETFDRSNTRQQNHNDGYDRQWNNLAYDDTEHDDRDAFNWTAESRDSFHNNTGADPFSRDQYSPAHNQDYRDQNTDRHTMYPDNYHY